MLEYDIEVKPMGTKNEELTTKDFFKFIRKKKLLTGIIAGSIFALSLVGLSVYAYHSNTYQATVILGWEGIEADRYPDSSAFNYLDIVSLANLQKAKYADSSLNSIDVDRMYDRDDASISRTFLLSNTISDQKSYHVQFTISLHKKYFSSSDQARLFFSQLIENNVYQVAAQLNNAYSINNSFFFQSDTDQYDIVFNNIETQAELIASYLEQTESYIAPSFVYDSETNAKISDLMVGYSLFLKSNNYETLRNIYLNEGYVRNTTTYIAYYTELKQEIENTIAYNNAYIDALQNEINQMTGSIISDSIMQEITTFTKENVTLTHQLQYIETVLSRDPSLVYNAEYDRKVTSYINTLTDYTNEVNKAYRAIFQNKMQLNYDTNAIIRKEGLKLPVILLLSAVLACVVDIAVLFFCFVGMNSEKRSALLNSPSLKAETDAKK